MYNKRAFTLIELITIVSMVAIGISLFLPMSVLFARDSGYDASVTQLRGIHTGLVLYAQGNNSYYVGIGTDGKKIMPNVGLSTQGRVLSLINDNYFTAEYARSPDEKQTGVTSYTMLKIDTTPDGKSVAQSIRNSEWRDTTNTSAAVISDRAIPVDASNKNFKSIYTNPKPGTTDWMGGVAWNDNHVTFEPMQTVETRYGTTAHDADDLFTSPNASGSGDDAFMEWHGTNGL